MAKGTIEFEREKNAEILQDALSKVTGQRVHLRGTVDLSAWQLLKQAVTEHIKGLKFSGEQLKADVEKYVAGERGHLIYYGMTAAGEHLFFRWMETTDADTQGATMPTGRCTLAVDGTFITHRHDVISTREMAELKGGDREKMLPSAVQFLIINACRYLGYDQHDRYWFFQPSVDGQNRPIERLTFLRIKPEAPDQVTARGSTEDNLFRAGGEALDFIPRMAAAGKLQWRGDLPEPPERIEHLPAKQPTPLTSGVDV